MFQIIEFWKLFVLKPIYSKIHCFHCKTTQCKLKSCTKKFYCSECYYYCSYHQLLTCFVRTKKHQILQIYIKLLNYCVLRNKEKYGNMFKSFTLSIHSLLFKHTNLGINPLQCPVYTTKCLPFLLLWLIYQ